MRELVVDVSRVVGQLESLLEFLAKIHADEWHGWLADVCKRAAGERGPGVQWVDLLWFFQLNYVPLVRFIRERSPTPFQDPEGACDQLSDHFEGILKSLNPDRPVTVCGFLEEGSRNDCTWVLGPLKPTFRLAAEITAFLGKYGEAIASDRFEEAYRMTSAGYRSLRGLRAYENAFSRASRRYGGEKVVGFALENMPMLYSGSDEKSYRSFHENWPNGVCFKDRRAKVVMHLSIQRETGIGFWQALKLIEEEGALRVASFSFFTQ